MKAFGVFAIFLIAYVAYKLSQKHANTNVTEATGHTSADANKNLTIVNPVDTNGKIIQAAGGSGSFINGINTLFKMSASVPMANVSPMATAKMVLSNDNGISNVAPIRQDVIPNSDINFGHYTGVMIPKNLGVDVVGSRYGQNLPDQSYTLQLVKPIMQTAGIVPTDARHDSPYTNYGAFDVVANDNTVPVQARISNNIFERMPMLESA